MSSSLELAPLFQAKINTTYACIATRSGALVCFYSGFREAKSLTRSHSLFLKFMQVNWVVGKDPAIGFHLQSCTEWELRKRHLNKIRCNLYHRIGWRTGGGQCELVKISSLCSSVLYPHLLCWLRPGKESSSIKTLQKISTILSVEVRSVDNATACIVHTLEEQNHRTTWHLVKERWNWSVTSKHSNLFLPFKIDY